MASLRDLRLQFQNDGKSARGEDDHDVFARGIAKRTYNEATGVFEETVVFDPETGSGITATWGTVMGSLSNQTDLAAALAARQPLNAKLTTYVATKIYRALLTQSGSVAPAATVLENTLGGTLVWSRLSAGAYAATLADAFPANKVIAQATAAGGISICMNVARGSSNNMVLEVFDGDGIRSDEILSDASFELIVYP